MIKKHRKEETTYETEWGDLTITHEYVQLLDGDTKEPYNERIVRTTLTASDWLTEEMVQQYRRWRESGGTAEKPDFLPTHNLKREMK